MGGTSTDVSHYDGEYERAFETEVAGVRMRAPMMLIHTVAAGGGSVLHFDGARFRVGPDSRRRQSRPEVLPPRRAARRHRRQCDGRQAHPGFLPEDFRPEPGPAARRRRGEARRSPSWRKEIGGKSPEEIADGFIKIAVENMANAIKKISVQRGYDVTRYALNCFGGAGGQHACLVADALGMTEVLIHPFSSLLSAYGMGLADIRATRQQAIEENLGAKSLAAIKREGGRLGKRRQGRGRRPGRAGRPRSRCIVRAHIRYAGTDTPLIVEAGTLAEDEIAPSRRRTRRASASSTAASSSWSRRCRSRRSAAARSSASAKHKTTRDQAPLARPHARSSSPTAQWHDAAVYTREQLSPGHKVNGPAIIIEPHQTIVRRRRLARRDHREEPSGARARRARSSAPRRSAPRPIRSCSRCSTTCSCRSPSRWACRCRTPPIRSTSRSGSTSPARCSPPTARWSPTRRTCRCISARWTARSRPSSARTRARSARATSYLINAPYNGGTHIPDLTVCTPVFDKRQAEDPVLGRLARPSRRHRRHRAGLDVADRHHRSRRKASTSTTSSWSIAANSARRRSTTCSPRRNIRRATRCRTSTT